MSQAIFSGINATTSASVFAVKRVSLLIFSLYCIQFCLLLRSFLTMFLLGYIVFEASTCRYKWRYIPQITLQIFFAFSAVGTAHCVDGISSSLRISNSVQILYPACNRHIFSIRHSIPCLQQLSLFLRLLPPFRIFKKRKVHLLQEAAELHCMELLRGGQ
jgi:hypothetical protein